MNLFFNSAITTKNPFNSSEEILEWIQERNRNVNVSIDRVSFDELENWTFDEKGNLSHVSGKFFSINGIQVSTNWGPIKEWDQPVINQPEIGLLGFITKIFDGVLYFLVQAKIEPGNVNNVQLSPTIQATKSNYTTVHGGKKPLYLDYFLNLKNQNILFDQLQSEQGARFLRKRNRNIIIRVDTEVEQLEDFVWMTLGQLKELMQLDNVVNMDTRTVISGIRIGESAAEYKSANNDLSALGHMFYKSEVLDESPMNSIDDIISWFTQLKSECELSVERVALKNVKDWTITSDMIHHKSNNFFKVIGTKVAIENREVKTWYQPLIEPAQKGICAFLIKEINGVIHFLVQGKMECGNFDTLEMAPTVQCLTRNYMNEVSISSLPFLDYVLNVPEDRIIYDTYQSEEGGRFFQEQNRNMIIKVESDFDEDLPKKYIWMTLRQLKNFIRYNNYLNIQARSLISGICYL